MIKNVEACKQLSKITRTSLGPNGASPRPDPPPALDAGVNTTRLVPIVRFISQLVSSPPFPSNTRQA